LDYFRTQVAHVKLAMGKIDHSINFPMASLTCGTCVRK
jgi:hypothetical protein